MKKQSWIFQIAMVVFMLLISVLTANASNVSCDDLDKLGREIGMSIPHDKFSYKVIGKGRAYFYLGPHEACENRTLFIIPGDTITVYEKFNEFYTFMYVAKDGSTYDGWIRADHVTSTGTGSPLHSQ